MDLVQLRGILSPLVIALKDVGTHDTLPALCEALGMPSPEAIGSKKDRMTASFDALSNTDLPNTARLFLSKHKVNASTRNAIEDILWSDDACPVIQKRFRRELARALDSERVQLYGDVRRFDELLDRLWVLDSDSLADFFGLVHGDRGLRAQIQQHVHRNPGDWSIEFLFDQLGAYDASDRRFALFLEGLSSADVQLDEAAQRDFVACANSCLHRCGAELREIGTQDGYPEFVALSLHAPSRGGPKNLIFASPDKPDLRFRDALDNDIEIVTNADKVLVYDRSIGINGLLWADLQRWWGETEGIAEAEEAKRTLYMRLHESLPPNSPPQTLLFEAFFQGFRGAVPQLPALLPEVWLHWDPRTVKERGREALLRFRMDFLLLLPQGIRVVIEVDGKHHYARADGQADAQRYAHMVAADRELKLAGYEVFRFGATELQGPHAKTCVKDFFCTLFKRYGVLP